MAQQINFKISSKHTGVTLEGISSEQAAILTENIVGTKGVSKITIIWTDRDGEDLELGEQDGETIPPPLIPSIDPVVESSEDTKQLPDDTPTVASHSLTHEEIKHPLVNLLITLDSKIGMKESITPIMVSLGDNLKYIETEDGRLLIKYYGTRVDTTWDNLNDLIKTIPISIPRGIPLLDYQDKGNRRTAVLKFIQQTRERSLAKGQSVEILYKLINHQDEVVEDTTGAVEDTKYKSREIPIFKELDRVNLQNLDKYVEIDKKNLGYYNQSDGTIVIYGSGVKVHTSWEDLFELPTYIDSESIETLKNLSQVVVRSFRKWMHDYPDQLPAGVDPDAEFRSAGVGQSVYPSIAPATQDFGKGGE